MAVIALLIAGSVTMIFPFLRAILWAMVFAVTIWPLFKRLEKALGGRTSLAALVPTLLLAVLFFLPLVYVGSKLVGQGLAAIDYAEGVMERGLGPQPYWLKGLPLVGDGLERTWRDVSDNTPRLIELLKPHIRTLLISMVSAGAGMARVGLTAILSLIIFFFLLKGGRSIGAVLEKMAERLGGERGRHLLLVAGSTMSSVVFGILGAALAQGVTAIFGLWISGVPRPVFVGTVAGLFALVPVGLIQVVLLPAAGWLVYEGHTGWGVFLFVWSILVVGNLDNVIRPMLISRGARIPFLVVFLGVLGGLASGGFIGLFVGATLLSVTYTLLKEWAELPAEIRVPSA